MRRGRAFGPMLTALVFFALASHTHSHKNYPGTTTVLKSISEESSRAEVDEQLQEYQVSPTIPPRSVLFSTMLATSGWEQYPSGSGAAGLEGGHTASPSAVANTLNWFNVNAGGFHTCGIRRYFNRSKHTLSTFDEFDHVNPDDAPGQMRCWGMNDYGQVHPIPLPLGEPPTEDTKDAYGRSNVACTRASESPRRIGKKGVNDGLPGEDLEVVRRDCWDWDDGWRNLSTGWLHTCGIIADGRLFCWGNDEHGEMGSLAMPKLLKEGQPACDTSNASDAAAGSLPRNCRAEFAGKYALTEFGGVAAGKRQTCAIKCVDDKAAEYVDPYVIDNSRNIWPSFPPATCKQGRVHCWGDDRLGQGAGGLSKGQFADYDDYISVCAAAAHSCAVREEGSLYCWGHNGNSRARVPQQLVNEKWRAVRCRGAHTCAVTTIDQLNRSSLYCWGHNGHRQSVVPAFAKQVLVPVEGTSVPSIRREIYTRAIFAFDTGDSHTCALWQTTGDERTCATANLKPPAMNGECWGDNSYSQTNLNLNFRPYGTKPADICDVIYYRALSTGSYHTCAISIDDVGLYCKKDSKCDEYPYPLCDPNCGNDNPLYRLEGAAISPCPRHIRGAVTQTPTRAYRDTSELIFDENEAYCVPARTNHLRCWGFDSHLQQFVPGLWQVSKGEGQIKRFSM